MNKNKVFTAVNLLGDWDPFKIIYTSSEENCPRRILFLIVRVAVQLPVYNWSWFPNIRGTNISIFTHIYIHTGAMSSANDIALSFDIRWSDSDRSF